VLSREGDSWHMREVECRRYLLLLRQGEQSRRCGHESGLMHG
jgi:hypothetical protein